MGGSYSQEEYERTALLIYEEVIRRGPCFLPDIGIDESLLKYSGSDSNAVLQAYSEEMLITVPGYVDRLGSVIGPVTSVPNAVGLGALVISLIIDIAIKAGPQTSADTYSLIRRVFGEEKASSVRDTMSEYLKRHQVYMNNNQRLREEIRRLEQELSSRLTRLRNSLLHDGQMSSRGLKIWVNGAAFHVQMLIHEARLDIQAGKPASDCVHEIKAAIDVYLRYLDPLLEKYKTYKINSNVFRTDYCGTFLSCIYNCDKTCYLETTEIESCRVSGWVCIPTSCGNPEDKTAFMDIVYSKYEPIKGLKSYFLNIKNNLSSRIRERGSFPLPSAAWYHY